ncbi:hypothetical protein GGI19_004364 [Coemansia pectinata]|uniref:Histone-lysine N-methyltransferase n=1 Tax=Coemansia pectinata TaxID=1052879 RepID=A0A9W8LA38_9FUNG|nr:hypothetical protein GGI19_004364 [Coemansia pectinata]
MPNAKGGSGKKRTAGRGKTSKQLAQKSIPKSSGSPESDDTSKETFDVEAIIGDMEYHGVHYFEVKWKGFDESENSWHPKADLGCPNILAQYMRTRTKNTADLTKFYDLLQDAAGLTISIVNTVDNVECPENFKYINENIYSEDVPRPCTPMFWCECTNSCSKDCECMEDSSYDEHGLLKAEGNERIVECGPRCKCDNSCANRVVQRGSNARFEIRRFANKGWGVVAKQRLMQGTFVAEYVGEVISYDEAERRGLEDKAHGLTYLFDLDKEFTGDIADFSIDAKTHGNVSHFFNHSCDPNMSAHAVYIEHRDPRLHHLAFFTTREVSAGEELTFDYSPSVAEADGLKMDTCYCGASNCRKHMYY